MNNETCNIHGQTNGQCTYKRISWTAIILGALVSIGISFLLNLFSTAINLSIVTTSVDGMQKLAVGGFIGILIATIVSTFVGGMVAGCLGKPFCTQHNLGSLYGFASWCVALIMMAFFASSLGNYVTKYSNFVTNPTAVVVTNNNTSPAVSAKDKSNVTVNAQKTTNDLGIATFLVFVLFSIGALSSSLGGHAGMSCNKCKNGCNCGSDSNVSAMKS